MVVHIIIHNMIIEYECDIEAPMEALIPEVELIEDENHHFQEFLARQKQIKYKKDHIILRNISIDHL